MDAIAYLRRSAKPKKPAHGTFLREEAVSLEQQAQAIELYAREAGLAVVATVAHDGVSGGKQERFEALWATLTVHHAGAVVAYHFDRLGRDLEHLLAFRKRCDRAGIQLHVVGQGILEPVRSSNGFITTAVHGLVAEHYRLVIGEKTKAALGQLRAHGRQWWGHRAPYGWQVGRAGGVERVPSEQALLDRLKALQGAQDRRSLRALSETLAAEGFVGRGGQPLAPSTLWRLCRRVAEG